MKPIFAILATAFLLASCGPTPPQQKLLYKWNIYDIPSVSEFDQKKKAAVTPTTAQIKKSLQLLADETAKDPESLKVRKTKVIGFRFFKSLRSDLQFLGHLIQADTDSKNSYGGYEGYQTKVFGIERPGSMAYQYLYPFEREEIMVADLFKRKRKELSDEEFVKWLKNGKAGTVVPEGKGRKDVYVFRSNPKVGWWIPKTP